MKKKLFLIVVLLLVLITLPATYFEDFETTPQGELPTGWSSVIEIENPFIGIRVTDVSAYEGQNCLLMSNSSYNIQIDTYATTPQTDNLPSKRIRFMGYSSFNGTELQVGTTETNSGDVNFVLSETITLDNEWTEYLVSFENAPATNNFIAFKSNGLGFEHKIDNVLIEDIPTTPIIVMNQEAIDFGDIAFNSQAMAELTIENIGTLPLEIELITDDAELTFENTQAIIEPETSQSLLLYLNPSQEGTYSGSLEVHTNDPTQQVININTSAFILTPQPENISIIGTGTELNQHLPIEPNFCYSYSQTIYYASEIDAQEARIEKLSWYHNGFSAFGPDDLIIYMAHTNRTEFQNNTDWIDFSEFTEVFNGHLNTTGLEGWVELILDVPFVYDNSQNLVIAVKENTKSYNPADDDFYVTNSPFSRALIIYDDYYNPDPSAPSSAYYVIDGFANIKLEFDEIPDGPELASFPRDINLGIIHVTDNSEEKTITLKSTGLQDVTISNPPVITGPNADEFIISTDDNNYPAVLSYYDSATFGITFTPSSRGMKYASIEIVDDITRQNHIFTLRAYAYDDFNNPASAVTVNLPFEGETYSIMPAFDKDWYLIPALGVGDTLRVYTQSADCADLDPDLLLYGPLDDPTDLGPAIAEGKRLDVVLPQSGNYYVRVSASSNYNKNVTSSLTDNNENSFVSRPYHGNTGLYNLFISCNYNYNYNIPTNLEATSQEGFIEVTWEEPPYQRYLTGYKLYRNGILLSEDLIDIGTNFYQDYDVTYCSEYDYYLRAFYANPDGFSLPTETITAIYENQGNPFWGDDFEDHPDFTLSLPNWIQYDIDEGATCSFENIGFENSGEAMSFMVFNSASTIPPMEENFAQNGSRFLASFSSLDLVNNDWLITPPMRVSGLSVVSFYARSYPTENDLARFKVKYSLGGSEVSDFIYSLHPSLEYIEAPNEWTLYHYDISPLHVFPIRLAIQNISEDSFMLMLDNFRIDSSADAVENESVENIPQITILNQNYPNPFNPETTISFDLPQKDKVELVVYNLKGQKVKTLINDEVDKGRHTIIWNGTNNQGKEVASGIYYYRLSSGNYTKTNKMVLIK